MKLPTLPRRRLLAAALLALAIPAAVIAAGPGTCRGGMTPAMDGPGMHRLDQLKLTDAQQTEVDALTDRYRPQMRQLMRAMHQRREELRQVNLAEEFDQKRADELATTLGRTGEELARLRTKMDRELAQILTPAQRQQLRELPAGRPRMGRHGGQGMRGGWQQGMWGMGQPG